MTTQEWRRGFIQALEEASDTDRQRKAWVDRVDSTFPQPVELVCQIFDDSGVDELLAEGRVFSQETDAILRRLGLLASKLDLEVGPAELLSSQAWREFSQQAARALAAVRLDA